MYSGFVTAVRQLAEHFTGVPTRSRKRSRGSYFLYLANEKQVARATATIALCGIRFFFEHTLQRNWTTLRFVPPDPGEEAAGRPEARRGPDLGGRADSGLSSLRDDDLRLWAAAVRRGAVAGGTGRPYAHGPSRSWQGEAGLVRPLARAAPRAAT